jgi:hypothetical protein
MVSNRNNGRHCSYLCRLGLAGSCEGLRDRTGGETTQWITRAATAHKNRTTNGSIERLSRLEKSIAAEGRPKNPLVALNVPAPLE